MADSNLQVNINGRDNLSPVLSQMESKLIRFVGAVSSAMAALKVASFPVTAAADFQREMANVKKTTEFTATQISTLGKELETLSLRINVSATDLAKIAAAAGQQGLGKIGPEGIAKFTESISRMASVLDVTAEQAANDMGKILNIFQTPIHEIENAVSAFNEASNNSTASGEELLNVVRRIGDAAGTINLKESIGLAATGIDFGMSPEVVGTSYSKVFADMRAKAADFAKLMKMDSKQWINVIDTKGGIEAYKMYLARLRQLDSASQAKAISELSGRGRIFALINKNVQDESDSVLNKNLGYSKGGYDAGDSAIKEQRTVLETLKEQFVILKNSIFALSTEAGEGMLAPLTAYVARLSEALQRPAVKSFVEAIGKSMLDLLGYIDRTAQFIGSLNVNWENLITVAKVMLGLKLLDMFTQMATRVNLVSTGTKQLISAIRGTTAATVQANAAQASGPAGQLAALITQWKAKTAAQREATAAVEAHAAAVRRAAASEQAANAAAAAAIQANANAKTAKTNAARATQAVADVGTLNANNIAALEQRKTQAQAAAIAKRDANIAAIEAQFRGRRTAEDRANKAALIAAENAHYARQLGGLNAAATRRANVEKLQADARLAAATLHEKQMTDIVKAAEAARLAARGRNAAAQAVLDRSAADVRRAQAEVERTRAAADNARGALGGMSAAFAGLAAAGRIALGVLSKAFFWISLIYMAADAFGLLDNIGGWLRKFTDMLGLTSEADRKIAQASKERRQKLEEEEKKVKDLADAYKKLKDGAGQADKKKLGELKEGVKNGGSELQTTNVGVLGNALIAGEREVANSKFDPKKYADEVNKASLSVADLADKWDTAKKKAELATRNNQSNWRELGMNADAAKIAYDAANQRLAVLKSTSETGLQSLAKTATETYTAVGESLTGMFTYASLDLFNEYVSPITALQAKYDELEKARAESEQAEKKFDPTKSADVEPLKAQRAKTEELAKDARKQASLLAEMRENFIAARNAFLNDDKVPEVVKNSVGLLDTFIKQGADQVKAIGTFVNKTAKPLTGLGAPKYISGKTTGNDVYEGSNSGHSKEESEARKLAKAKLALARAEFEAEADLKKKLNDQKLADDQRLYDKGLKDIESYFEERRRIQLAANDVESTKLAQEIGAVEDTQAYRKAQGAAQSELVGFDVELKKLRGKLTVLRAERKAINTAAKNDTEDAIKAFTNKVLTTELSLADTLGVKDLDKFFNQTLKAYADEWEVFLNQLRTKGDAASLKLAEDLQTAGRMKAVGARIEKEKEPATEATDNFDRQMAKLELLRQTGRITTADMEKEAAKQRKATAAIIQESIIQNQLTLAMMTKPGDEGTKAYKDLQKAINDAGLELAKLQLTANQVALNINRDIGAGLTKSMTTLLSGRQKKERTQAQQDTLEDNRTRIENLRDSVFFLERASSGALKGYEGAADAMTGQLAQARTDLAQLEEQSRRIREDSKESVLDLIKRSAKEFGISMAESIRNAITENLSQGLMKSFTDETGGGGIGGFFAGILGGDGKMDGSKGKPLWVRDVNGAPGDAAKEAADGKSKIDPDNPISSALTLMKDKLSGAFSFITDKMKGLLGSLGENFGDLFGGLGKSLQGMLGDLFSAISNSGAGQAIGSMVASFFHTGGVVGMQRTTTALSPSMFMGASRYHTGGIAGLRPDEVPAILQRGEEVLTAGDPRHRDNGGAMGTTNSVEVNVHLNGGESSTASSEDAAKLGKAVSQAVQIELQKQQRPGGLLYGK